MINWNKIGFFSHFLPIKILKIDKVASLLFCYAKLNMSFTTKNDKKNPFIGKKIAEKI